MHRKFSATTKKRLIINRLINHLMLICIDKTFIYCNSFSVMHIRIPQHSSHITSVEIKCRPSFILFYFLWVFDYTIFVEWQLLRDGCLKCYFLLKPVSVYISRLLLFTLQGCKGRHLCSKLVQEITLILVIVSAIIGGQQRR